MSDNASLIKTLEFNLRECPDAAAWARQQWAEKYRELTGKEWKDGK